MNETTSKRIVFICGSAIRGQPDHENLKGAECIGEAATVPAYRLHAVGDGLHPGIYQADHGGISIPGELYAMTAEQFTYLSDNEPPNMYAQEVQLVDGTSAIAFLYPRGLIEKNDWPDISRYGGWAAYKAATN